MLDAFRRRVWITLFGWKLRRYPYREGIRLVSISKSKGGGARLTAHFSFLDTFFQVLLHHENGGWFWRVTPYNESFFQTRAREHDGLFLVQLAMIEHINIHRGSARGECARDTHTGDEKGGYPA